MAGREGEVLAVAILFMILSWLTVSLRVYVRGIMVKNWDLDDWWMLATLGLFTVYLSFQLVAAVHGTGRHRWEITDENARIAFLFWYLCEILYVVSNCTLKISIGIFYLRVAIARWHIWIIRLLMVGTVLFGAVYFFLVIFQCIPISEFWNNYPASSKCIAQGPTKGITYALGALNAFADWALGTLPMFIVWDLQINVKTKILVAGILAFASIGSTATIVRMQYIHTLTNGPDFLYATTDVAIWSTVEPGIGITASSLATLRPLFQRYMRYRSRENSNASPISYHSSWSGMKRRKRQGYLTASDLVPTDNVGTTSTTISGPNLPMQPIQSTKKKTFSPWNYNSTVDAHDNDNIDAVAETSEPYQGHRIMQSVVLEQEVEGPPRLQLRDSMRYSFTRGTILSLRRYKER